MAEVSEQLARAFSVASHNAQLQRRRSIEPEDLFRAFLAYQSAELGGLATNIIFPWRKRLSDRFAWHTHEDDFLPLDFFASNSLPWSPLLQSIMAEAELVALQITEQDFIETSHVLLAFLNVASPIQQALTEQGIDHEYIHRMILDFPEQIMEMLPESRCRAWQKGSVNTPQQARYQIGCFSFLAMPLYFLTMLMFSVGVVFITITMGYWEVILLLMAAITISCSLGAFATIWETLSTTPIIGHFVRRLHRVFLHYHQYGAGTTFYYMFYFFTFPACALFSRSARKEFVLFLPIYFSVTILVLIQFLFSYPGDYVPYLGLSDALSVFMIQMLFLVMAMSFSVGVVSHSVMMRLTRSYFRFVVLISLTLFGFVIGFASYYSEIDHHISGNTLLRMQHKIDHPGFARDLDKRTEQFLQQHIDNLQKKAPESVVYSELTTAYQKEIIPISSEQEVRTLKVFTLKTKTGEVWLGTRFETGFLDSPHLLHMMSPQKKLYTSWHILPDEVQAMFVYASDNQENINPIMEPNPIILYFPRMLDEYEFPW